MYKRIKRHRLGRKKSHRESLMRNLLRSLFDNNYLVTTSVKAKVLKQEATALIERGKEKGDETQFRRKLKDILGKESLISKYKEYLKKDKVGVTLVKVGFRDGDNTEMSRVSLIGMDRRKVDSKRSKKSREKVEDQPKDKKKTPLEKKDESPESLKRIDKTAALRKTARRPKARAGL
jgi:large subunit ribosomal protein L17